MCNYNNEKELFRKRFKPNLDEWEEISKGMYVFKGKINWKISKEKTIEFLSKYLTKEEIEEIYGKN